MMAKRRGHGEGSIYQRKDSRWVARNVLVAAFVLLFGMADYRSIFTFA